MRLATMLGYLAFASAKVLVSYNASHGDQPSVLGLQNLQGWDRADWPKGQSQNSSCFVSTATDPQGVSAGHVHKNAHFTRSEYHSMVEMMEVNTTYYIGYKVMFEAVDYQTIAWQLKEYVDADTDDIPLTLVFRKDADGNNNHTISFGAQPDPSAGHGSVVWSKQLTMGKTYLFAIVVNTSRTKGFTQLYFDGQLVTLKDPASGKQNTTLTGNFFPGRAEPKFGLYGGDNGLECDSYIYNVVIGTQLADIASVVGISV